MRNPKEMIRLFKILRKKKEKDNRYKRIEWNKTLSCDSCGSNKYTIIKFYDDKFYTCKEIKLCDNCMQRLINILQTTLNNEEVF